MRLPAHHCCRLRAKNKLPVCWLLSWLCRVAAAGRTTNALLCFSRCRETYASVTECHAALPLAYIYISHGVCALVACQLHQLMRIAALTAKGKVRRGPLILPYCSTTPRGPLDPPCSIRSVTHA